jgi:O-antigen ligase
MRSAAELRLVRIRGALDRTDLVGALLVAALVGWVAFSAAVNGTDAGAMVAAIVLVVAAHVLGRTLAAEFGPTVPSVIALAGVATLLVDPLGSLSDAPLAGPLGYANAKAAFFVQCAAAASMVVAMRRRAAVRIAAGCIGLAFAVIPWLIGAVGAGLGVLAVASTIPAAVRRRGSGTVVTVLGLAVGFTICLTFVAGTVPDSPVGRGMESFVGERRTTLWNEALDITASHPISGVGPDRFSEVSPTARNDADAAHAHNEFLEMSAEAGVVGGLLLVAVFAWLFVRLRRSGSGAPAVVAAGAVAAMGIHASVDYILRYPVVPAIAVALVGVAVATSEGSPASAHAQDRAEGDRRADTEVARGHR